MSRLKTALVPFGEGHVLLRQLSAAGQLRLSAYTQYILQLLPMLGLGADCPEAAALAHNVATIFLCVDNGHTADTPWYPLEQYTLEEIAALMQLYQEFLSGETLWGTTLTPEALLKEEE